MRAERRTQNLQSLVWGTVHRRRRTNRRPADDQVFIPDVHARSTCMVAFGILLLSCLDALFTLNIISLGGEEVNPAMQVLLETSTLSFLIVKYCLTAGGVILLLLYSRVRLAGLLPAGYILNGIFGAYSALMIYHIYLLLIATTR